MLSFLSFLALALSSQVLAELDFQDWAPPGEDDVRGPCPALNSLANHNFLPHNGRNITVDLLSNVTQEVFNMSPEFSRAVSQLGANAKPPPVTGFFDLPDLNKHNAFEHDGSVSRVDLFFSGQENIATFSQERFDEFMSTFDGLEIIDNKAAAAARYKMIQGSRANTPDFTYLELHRAISYSETVKYMRTMVDATGQTKKEFVKILFEQQRLPFNEGWRSPTELKLPVLDGLAMAGFMLELALATPEKTLFFNEVAPPGKENQTTFDIPKCSSTNTTMLTTRNHARGFSGYH